jgi:hypothetical protein
MEIKLMSYFTNHKPWLNVLLALVFCGFGPAVSAVEFHEIDMLADWGIEPVHLRFTAAGYMIEFRYKVIDPEKATVLSHNKIYPRLKAMKSRARLVVPYFPTTGFAKSHRKFLKAGKNYVAIFSNENRHLLPGDEARVQIDDAQSAVMTVE